MNREQIALKRCLTVLTAQNLTPDSGVKHEPIGGRFGGVLEGDWDSAIHVIPEVLLRPESWLLETSAVLAAGAKHPERSVEALLEHVHELIASPNSSADTLRINYLALMALVRRAVLPPEALGGSSRKETNRAATELRRLADSSWKRLFSPTQPAWVPLDELRDTSALTVPGDLLFQAQDFVEALTLELDAAEAAGEEDRGLQVLRAKLRAFVLLAALPSAQVRARLEATPAGRSLQTSLLSLYARAAGRIGDTASIDWPPIRFFWEGNLLVTGLYFVTSRLLAAGTLDYDRDIEVNDCTFNTLAPSGESVSDLLKSLGTVPQAKDLLGAIGLLAIPSANLGSEKAETWQDFLQEARGPLDKTVGLYCYLPVTTGVAVTALQRYVHGADGKNRGDIEHSVNQSLSIVRSMRVRPGKISHGLPFAQFSLYNEMFINCYLLALDLPSDLKRLREFLALATKHSPSLSPAIQYLMSCRSENDLFHERYGSNEPDEGETFAAGICMRTLANVSRKLVVGDARKSQLPFSLDGYTVEGLQREIALTIERTTRALLDTQNVSGGFATFARTDREKRGLLGTAEGPGAQETLLYDAPAADIVAWVLQGLAEVRSGAKPIPLLSLPRSRVREVDLAIERAVSWLRRDFHPEAGWWARYGGGYVRGTAATLCALAACGVPSSDWFVQRGAALLLHAQNADGGWGQSAEADDPKHNDRPRAVAMKGTSDPELAGLALMGLLDAGVGASDARILRGIDYLCTADSNKGAWISTSATHCFMRGWNYRDQMHTDMRPAEAILKWYRQLG